MNDVSPAVAAAVAVALVAATVVSALRWLRVCQREHYLPGSTSTFFQRWQWSSPANTAATVAKVVTVVAGLYVPAAWLGTAALIAITPIGLPVRGRTGSLAWTARLRRLAGIAVAVAVVVVAVTALIGVSLVGLVVVALLVPVLIDAAAAIAKPIEARMLGRFVDEAAEKLRRIDPTVIAITGSYGKTSTKEYVRALLGRSFEVCPSPASFNNRAGLARAVNESLHPGAQFFIAEMGTYGPGEIRELCSWVPPRVSILTAIGPVHLERMKTLDTIVTAKREIFERAEVAVLNVDDPKLAPLADELAAGGMRVVRCGSVAPDLDVRVSELSRDDDATRVRIEVGGQTLEAAAPEGGLQLTNLACAIGAATAVGLDASVIPAGVADIHAPAHRQVVERGPSGIWVIDDSFNSNPAGARSALARLMAIDTTGRRVIVTPGMVELGATQAAENEAFAREAAAQVDDLVVVTRTNRAALLAGAAGGRAKVHWFPHRDAATEWVRAELRDGDAVLYENDLPDIFP